MNETKGKASFVFATLCVAAALIVAGAFYRAVTRNAEGQGHVSVSGLQPGWAAQLATTGGNPPRRVYFRHTGLGADYGKLAYADAQSAGNAAVVDELSCETAYVAGGRGICLGASRGVVTTYSAKVFDAATLQTMATYPLSGVPSRTRVSADGTVGAMTVFVTGHGYDSVDFSTQTVLVNLDTGALIGDLESFAVYRDGERISNPDFNFWGVTFTPDAQEFFATLSTSGTHLLVKGNIAARTAEVLHENVECPSLSPDGTKVAYKRRYVENARIFWRLHVLDVGTQHETPLAEERSVDDQLEWSSRSPPPPAPSHPPPASPRETPSPYHRPRRRHTPPAPRSGSETPHHPPRPAPSLAHQA